MLGIVPWIRVIEIEKISNENGGNTAETHENPWKSSVSLFKSSWFD